MAWTVSYFDRQLNREAVSRAFASQEDALRHARDLLQRNCLVQHVHGPSGERINTVEIATRSKGGGWRKRLASPK
jgi:hypothetical protein